VQEVSKFEGRKGSIDLEESWTSFRKKQFAEAVEELLSNDILTKEQIEDLRNDFETLGFEIDISEREITVDSIDLKDSMDDFEIER
jgi:late competence protein required for DNA uptake (superfamily II DNA/RNA helicase)